MATRARYLRAAGAVLNGFVRDAAGIEALGFPTFSRGLYTRKTRGRAAKRLSREH
jgi:4-hydroxy-4-methyl-2-oxoglutarate aldolase